MKKLIFALICMSLVIPCLARTITVDNDGPADFNNIQAAINNANDGDEIIVADGIYTGDGNRDIDFNGLAITVHSENGPTNCIIDCNASASEPHRAFIFDSGEGSESVLRGFTITGCYAEFNGGGILCDDASPKIINCIFRGNIAGGSMLSSGGGLACSGFSEPEIINCTFSNNSAELSGGGIGGGYCQSSPPEVIVRNCIVWNNTPSDDPGVCIGVYSKNCKTFFAVDYSLLQSDWQNRCSIKMGGAQGIIVADPCFADPCSGDYHLQSQAGRWDPNTESWVTDANTSIAIDAGDPNSDWTAELWPHGKQINMGAYGGTAEASMSSSDVGNIADLDNNDDVNYADLMLFTDKWLYQKVLLSEDLNRNRFVDFNDFAIFGDNWPWP